MYEDIKKPVTVGLPLSTIAALKKVAQKQERSLSFCVTRAIKEYLERMGEIKSDSETPSTDTA